MADPVDFRETGSDAGEPQTPDLPQAFGRKPVGGSGKVPESSASVGGSQAFGGGIYKASKVKQVSGRGPVPADPRKFRYDVLAGASANTPFAVTKDDRMSASEAGAVLHSIHVMFGIDRELEDVLTAFDRGLFFCHTVNGGSVLNPGRSKFSIPGVSQEFDFSMVRDKLGVDMRRFFRAYADDVTAVNKRVLDEYDPYDPVKSEHWGWLMQVASERGLHRLPHLAHDSADACVNISQAERAALSQSRVSVISSVVNSADRMNANNRVTSADGFDSTNKSSI